MEERKAPPCIQFTLWETNISIILFPIYASSQSWANAKALKKVNKLIKCDAYVLWYNDLFYVLFLLVSIKWMLTIRRLNRMQNKEISNKQPATMPPIHTLLYIVQTLLPFHLYFILYIPFKSTHHQMNILLFNKIVTQKKSLSSNSKFRTWLLIFICRSIVIGVANEIENVDISCMMFRFSQIPIVA